MALSQTHSDAETQNSDTCTPGTSNSLPFPLIADTDKRLVTELGAYGEKKMYGRVTMGTLRTTFIADADGVVTAIFGPKQIKVKEHAAQILG